MKGCGPWFTSSSESFDFGTKSCATTIAWLAVRPSEPFHVSLVNMCVCCAYGKFVSTYPLASCESRTVDYKLFGIGHPTSLAFDASNIASMAKFRSR